MEPIIKSYAEVGDIDAARLFLEQGPHHFLLVEDYLPQGFPAELCSRVIKLGSNQRPGYIHLPLKAGPVFIRSFCRMVLQEQEQHEEVGLDQFLQMFLAQIKDMDDLSEVANNITTKVSELFDSEGSAIMVFDEEEQALRFVAAHTLSPDVGKRLLGIRIPTGKGVAGWVAENKKPLLVHRVNKDPRFFAEVDAKTEFVTRDLMAAPILLGNRLIGVVEVVNRRNYPFCDDDIPTLSVFASVIAIFLEKAQLLAERKRHLQAVDKAEIANSVLHNIGNVLSSLLVACGNIQGQLDNRHAEKLSKTSELLAEYSGDLGSFFARDPRGPMVQPFLQQISHQMLAERRQFQEEIAKIADKTHLMRDIIETQQTIARAGTSELQDLIQIIEEALAVVSDRLKEQDVAIIRDFHTDKPVRGQKTKLIHIFINLLKNGAEAMLHLPKDERVLKVETHEQHDGRVCAGIVDQGYGIKKEDHVKLFNHGFTTKEDGHGFGLDFCAKAMEEMHGRIEATSDGEGKGATFTLSFPDFNDARYFNEIEP